MSVLTSTNDGQSLARRAGSIPATGAKMFNQNCIKNENSNFKKPKRKSRL